MKQEEASLFEMADYIIRAGANAVFCSKGMDDKIAAYLQNRGIYATRRVKNEDMQHLVDATGGRPVRNIKELTEKNLVTQGFLNRSGMATRVKPTSGTARVQNLYRLSSGVLPSM